MRIGMAADHGGYLLKERLRQALTEQGDQVDDFGAPSLEPADDYPDYVIPLARAVAAGAVERGIAICSSGVGASIAANKVPGVRAALVHDDFSARQGVEDDNLNVICLGSKVVDYDRAVQMVARFLAARFSGAERHRRRLGKIALLEREEQGK
jgi:RpiB/LacA/LacB family sugar-phosphate isomerase